MITIAGSEKLNIRAIRHDQDPEGVAGESLKEGLEDFLSSREFRLQESAQGLRKLT